MSRLITKICCKRQSQPQEVKIYVCVFVYAGICVHI